MWEGRVHVKFRRQIEPDSQRKKGWVEKSDTVDSFRHDLLTEKLLVLSAVYRVVVKTKPIVNIADATPVR